MKKFLVFLLAVIIVTGIGSGVFFGVKYRKEIKNEVVSWKDTVVSWFDKEEPQEDVEEEPEEIIDYESLYNEQLAINGDLNDRNINLSLENSTLQEQLDNISTTIGDFDIKYIDTNVSSVVFTISEEENTSFSLSQGFGNYWEYDTFLQFQEIKDNISNYDYKVYFNEIYNIEKVGYADTNTLNLRTEKEINYITISIINNSGLELDNTAVQLYYDLVLVYDNFNNVVDITFTINDIIRV